MSSSSESKSSSWLSNSSARILLTVSWSIKSSPSVDRLHIEEERRLDVVAHVHAADYDCGKRTRAFGCFQREWYLTERCLGQRRRPVPQRSSSLAEMRPRWPRNDTDNVADRSLVEEAAAGSTSGFDTGPHRCCSLERFETEIWWWQLLKTVVLLVYNYYQHLASLQVLLEDTSCMNFKLLPN